MDKVSVIIPTYNRFKYLLNAIRSVKAQTYKNIEIIIVNDCSTQKEYYTFDFKEEFGDNLFIIHLPKNSKEIYGFPSPGGHQRNIGMMLANGIYVAFLDDDDSFLPTKIEKQIKAMKTHNCSISCTEAYGGRGPYNSESSYRTYHYNGIFWGALRSIFTRNNKRELLDKMYEKNVNVWGKEEIKVHNCIVCSSVVIKKNIIKHSGYFPIKHTADDYALWLEIIKHTNCVFVREPLTYYDFSHGDGQNYS